MTLTLRILLGQWLYRLHSRLQAWHVDQMTRTVERLSILGARRERAR